MRRTGNSITGERLDQTERFLSACTDEVAADTGGAQRPHVGGSYGREKGDLRLC